MVTCWKLKALDAGSANEAVLRRGVNDEVRLCHMQNHRHKFDIDHAGWSQIQASSCAECAHLLAEEHGGGGGDERRGDGHGAQQENDTHGAC